MIELTDRVIGHYVGEEPGPLVVAIGGIHGNEPAGVRALERLFELLEEEPLLNPGFVFRGELLALRGNVAALRTGQRFIDVDLNRIWIPQGLPARGEQPMNAEERELDGLLATIDHALSERPVDELILLDLHTTSAEGGVFAITGDDRPSLLLAAELGVPVIKGMLSNLQGTTLSYFRSGHYDFRHPCRAITFEAGGHDEPTSAPRALAATVSLLRAVGCVNGRDVSTHHDRLLKEQRTCAPPLLELAYVHRLDHGRDDFRMERGYENFQPVTRGATLGYDAAGPVLSPCEGYLLMPLYQAKGDEGFFIVRPLPPPAGY